MSTATAVLLQALGAGLKQVPNLRLETLILFLAVCENEGIGVKELVFICGLSDSMVSRTVDSLAGPGGLFTVQRHASDGRRRLVTLSQEGAALRDELSEILAQQGDPA